MPNTDRAAANRFLVVAGSTLLGATLAVVVLQDVFQATNPSAIYLVAVVATAIVAGPWAAAATSVAAFLLYNLLFVEPRYTLTVANVRELLNLFLLLFVGLVVGHLAARERARADDAIAREREARALSRVSRERATRGSTPAGLPTIAAVRRDESGKRRVWISLGPDTVERVAADTGEPEPRPAQKLHWVLQRMPGDVPARWSRVHQPAALGAGRGTVGEAYRVRIEAAGEPYGSLWAIRRETTHPTRSETRLLSAAADQLGQALRQDRLAAPPGES